MLLYTEVVECHTVVFQALEGEMTGKWPWCEKLCKTGQELISGGHETKKEINTKIKNLKEKWDRLQKLAAIRRTKIEDGIEAHQVCYIDITNCFFLEADEL